VRVARGSALSGRRTCVRTLGGPPDGSEANGARRPQSSLETTSRGTWGGGSCNAPCTARAVQGVGWAVRPGVARQERDAGHRPGFQ
jgi:hypothetical protein